MVFIAARREDGTRYVKRLNTIGWRNSRNNGSFGIALGDEISLQAVNFLMTLITAFDFQAF
jgi:hypothetical protein